MSERRTPSAEYFDGWYADMVGSPRKDEVCARHLGLPPELLSTSLLGWDGLAEVVQALRLSPGQVLLDLACGRGGYGLEVARRTGARLVGVDFSAEALRQATGLAGRWGVPADFRLGDLSATGLPDASVEAALVVDAVQFADPPGPAYRELRRVLVPGGRVVLTCWEAVDRSDEQLPAPLRQVDLAAGLEDAGFEDVLVRERADWRAAERALWEEAVRLDPAGDPALQAFSDEGVWSLERWDSLRRVVATATAPDGTDP